MQVNICEEMSRTFILHYEPIIFNELYECEKAKELALNLKIQRLKDIEEKNRCVTSTYDYNLKKKYFI